MQCFVRSKAHPSVAAAGPHWSNSLVVLSQCVADSAILSLLVLQFLSRYSADPVALAIKYRHK